MFLGPENNVNTENRDQNYCTLNKDDMNKGSDPADTIYLNEIPDRENTDDFT